MVSNALMTVMHHRDPASGHFQPEESRECADMVVPETYVLCRLCGTDFISGVDSTFRGTMGQEKR